MSSREVGPQPISSQLTLTMSATNDIPAKLRKAVFNTNLCGRTGHVSPAAPFPHLDKHVSEGDSALGA